MSDPDIGGPGGWGVRPITSALEDDDCTTAINYNDLRSHSRSTKREKHIRNKTHPRSNAAIGYAEEKKKIKTTNTVIQLHAIELQQQSSHLPQTKNHKNHKNNNHESINRSKKRVDRRSSIVRPVEEETTSSASSSGEDDGDISSDSSNSTNYTFSTPSSSRSRTITSTTSTSTSTLHQSHRPHHQLTSFPRGDTRSHTLISVKTAEALGASYAPGPSCRPRRQSSKIDTPPVAISLPSSSPTASSGARTPIWNNASSTPLDENHVGPVSAGTGTGVVSSNSSNSHSHSYSKTAAAVPRSTLRTSLSEDIFPLEEVDLQMRELATWERSRSRVVGVRLEEIDEMSRRARAEEALGRVVEGAVERWEGR